MRGFANYKGWWREKKRERRGIERRDERRRDKRGRERESEKGKLKETA